MSYTSDAAALVILDGLYGSGHMAAAPATLYLALYEVIWDDGGTGGVEASYVGYTRPAVTNNTTNFPAAVDRLKTLVTQVNFPTPTADTPMYVAAAFHTHPTNDAFWHGQFLPEPVSALAGEPLRVLANKYKVRIPV